MRIVGSGASPIRGGASTHESMRRRLVSIGLWIGLFRRYAVQVGLGLALIGLSAAAQLASVERREAGLDTAARSRTPLRTLVPKGPSLP